MIFIQYAICGMIMAPGMPRSVAKDRCFLLLSVPVATGKEAGH